MDCLITARKKNSNLENGHSGQHLNWMIKMNSVSLLMYLENTRSSVQYSSRKCMAESKQEESTD